MNESTHSTKIHPEIVRVGSMQLLFFAAYGTMIPFFSIYYRIILRTPEGGPDYGAIGVVLFLQSISGIVSPPLAGFLADKFKIQNRLVTVCAAMVAAAGLLIGIPGMRLFGIPLSLPIPVILLLTGTGAVVNGLFVRPIIPLIDTETLKTLHRLEGNTDGYGRIRLFGSLGFVVTCTTFGWVLERVGILTVNILGYSGMFLLLAVVASFGFKAEIRPVSIPWKLLKDDHRYRKFLLFILVLAIGMSGSFMFTGVFMEDSGLGFFAMGISFSLAALVEIPVLFNARRLLMRLGNRGLIRIGVSLMILKLVAFVVLAESGPLAFILAQGLFQGFGFSMMFLGFINFMDRQAHEDLKATYQNLYHLTFALGGSVGNLAASYVIGISSSRLMMALAAIVMTVSLFYFLVQVYGHPPGRAVRPAE
jgi:MFS transporter, PPP family, 3-phenylpropionic acid transporter